MQFRQIGLGPRNTVVQSPVEADLILPAELLPQFATVEQVSGVLAQTLTDDFHDLFEIGLQLSTDSLYELTHGHDLVCRDVIGGTCRSFTRDAPGRIRNVFHVNE